MNKNRTKKKSQKDFQWKIKIRFVPFDSDEERERSYELWAKSFYRVKKGEMSKDDDK